MCIMYPQALKLFGGEHSLTYRVDIILNTISFYNLEEFSYATLHELLLILVQFFLICGKPMVKSSLMYS